MILRRQSASSQAPPRSFPVGIARTGGIFGRLLALSHRRVYAEARIPILTGDAAMSKPNPEPIDSARLPELARAVVRDDHFPHLATIDGDQPRVRPVSPVRTDGFTIYVANLRGYHKTAEIAANPRVELCYLDNRHDQVRITGVAEVVTDRGIVQQIWDTNPLLRQYLGSIDNPELIVYCIRPERVRFMREWALEYHEVPI
jgi:general stress protein 26